MVKSYSGYLTVMAREGYLNGDTVFLFTDNYTEESALLNGYSSSKGLFEIILEFQKF